MIYQLNNSFKFFPFKATIGDNTFMVDDKGEFERNYLRNLKDLELIQALREGREPVEVELPEITYEEITHTKEEEERLERCQGVNASLDDVKYYVQNGIYPEGHHSLAYLELQDTKDTNVNLGNMLFQTQSELLKSKEENELLASQIFEIQTNIINK